MKKSILLLAVAASFAACTQNEEINDAISQQEIKFDQVLNKTTKAEIVNSSDLATPGFSVFGKKTPNAGGDAFWVFGKDSEANGTQVSSNNDGESWSYTGTQYWDKVATYNFYAAAPYNANITFDKETELFTFSNVTWGTATDVAYDYLIDRNGATVNAAEEGATKNAVAFEFHHVMAKVDFKVMTTIDGVKINKLVMQGWNANEATFAQVASAANLDETWSVIDYSEWAMEDATLEGKVIVSSESISITQNAEAVTYGETYIMVPQNIAALKFIVDYEIAGEPFINQPVTLASVWGTDSHITYTLNIGGGSEPINFTVNSVCGFCVNPGTEDPEVDVKP
ncbi:MAG: fimbrillin family protein [Bacteroidaceae bacterium]|nr:fimbrillin family protein [Bacteroidaceae bacterium]